MQVEFGLCLWWEECKLIQLIERAVYRFPHSPKVELAYEPTIPHLDSFLMSNIGIQKGAFTLVLLRQTDEHIRRIQADIHTHAHTETPVCTATWTCRAVEHS